MGRNDGLVETEHVIQSLQRHWYPSPNVLVSVVGSLGVLDLLTHLSPQHLVWFDINPHAVAYGQLYVELIRNSPGPQEFLSAIFCRDARRFEAAHGQITHRNQDAFLETPENR